MNFNIVDFGAQGVTGNNNSAAIQRAIDACAKAGGGRVVVPAGQTFQCGPFKLASHVELYLESGARLSAIPDITLYPEYGLQHLGGEGQKWIHADNAEFISITGAGIIDGCGVQWMKKEEKYFFRMDPGRPFTINLENCRHVTIKGITILDAPFWTIHVLGCNDVLFESLRILNNLKLANNDGIDIDRSKNVRIVGCHIETDDDCICIKSEEPEHEALYGSCENIIAQNCTMISTSCAVKIGTGTFGVIKNIVIDSCIITRSNRGLGLWVRDGGSICDVIFSNIIIETRIFHPSFWGSGEPIYVTAFSRKAGHPSGTIKNIDFRNIICKSDSGVFIEAEAANTIQNILLDNVRLEITKHPSHPGGFHDRRPCATEGILKKPTAGFFISNAAAVTLKDCAVRWGENPPEYYRHAVESENAPELNITGFRGVSAFPQNYPPMNLR